MKRKNIFLSPLGMCGCIVTNSSNSIRIIIPVLQRTDTLTVRITEKVVIGTVSWYRFAGGIFGNTGLFRNEGNFVHMSDDMGKTDRVFYDFTPWENPEDETSRFMLIDGFCASPRYRKSFETPIGVFEGYQCSFNLCDFHCGRERLYRSGNRYRIHGRQR